MYEFGWFSVIQRLVCRLIFLSMYKSLILYIRAITSSKLTEVSLDQPSKLLVRASDQITFLALCAYILNYDYLAKIMWIDVLFSKFTESFVWSLTTAISTVFILGKVCEHAGKRFPLSSPYCSPPLVVIIFESAAVTGTLCDFCSCLQCTSVVTSSYQETELCGVCVLMLYV